MSSSNASAVVMRALLVALSAALTGPALAAGQSAPGYGPLGPRAEDFLVPVGVLDPVPAADAHYYEGDPRSSFELLERHLEAVPDDYDALWRAARAGVVLGVSEEGPAAQNQWLDPAMEYGDRAVALRPDGVDALYWRGAAHGRRAMNASPGYATELAQQVFDDAHAILAMDEDHGGAHNLLGKLSYEVMSLSRFERVMGRIFMGKEALSEASWERAEHHLGAAARLWPDLVLFQFDLALFYDKRDREEEARQAFRRVLELEAVHPPDFDLQDRARARLKELGT